MITAELFFLLEAAESNERLVASGARRDMAFAPSRLSVRLSGREGNKPFTTPEMFGAEGRMVQLAYVGWIAAVDGLWEKHRRDPPWEKSQRLRLGQEADLFGDLHKIRNDLLKNRGIAQKKNTGKCIVLHWFEPGARIQLTLDHVLDFLHQLGCYLRSTISWDEKRAIRWYLKHEAPDCEEPERVVSYRVLIEQLDQDAAESKFGLIVSLVFADGTVSAVPVAHADSRIDLSDHCNALASAPRDARGAPISPYLGELDVPKAYKEARRALRDGRTAFDPGSPWIRFRA